ncbi:MAG: sugar nucleotide-binding protein [Candidatus Cloacimonetes bacterium]|jgi:nucleoside-diphosphate-sugar epimerase|nr:sugar nucleotide-binding protein [Candidatus Cloacimonadota bacterium]NLO44796.1 sugar nucleotide-binding protein [Candidatus Cloacimonadota bacterium]
MKVAITGANGFVGKTLLRKMKERGFEPRALVRKPFNCQGIDCRIINYEDPKSIAQAIKGCDVLIHNAGKTKTISFTEMLNVNVGLTRRIVEAVNLQENPMRLIYMSTQAVSGPASAESPAVESAEMNPLSIYGKSKALAERLIRNQCKKPFNIIRPCPVYGPGDVDFLSLFRLSKLGFSFQVGSEDKPINMIYSEQLADFIMHVITNSNVNGESFYATDCRVYTQAEIARMIAQAIGKKEPKNLKVPPILAHGVFGVSDVIGRIRHMPSAVNLEKYNEIMAEGWVADCTKAKQLLGWDPADEIEQKLEETYKWYIENDWL